MIVACVWLSEHFADTAPLYLLSDNDVVQQAAVNFGINVLSVERYLEQFYSGRQELRELFATLNATHDEELRDNGDNDDAQQQQRRRRTLYDEHESEESLLSGVRNARLCRGTLHVNSRLANEEAYVASPTVDGGRIYVLGNRRFLSMWSDAT